MFGSKVAKCDYKEPVERLVARFETTAGQFKVELHVRECPETVWNFVNLAEGRQESARKGPFYDGLVFHRVIDGFMIQGGCPDGNGRGGPGYKFGDEFRPELKHSGAGILSMANSGPGTNGSQFFITLAATPHLNNRHSVFGKVIEGLDVVARIGKVETTGADRPVEEIQIVKLVIERPAPAKK
ncbi:MAG: peptidylprolyl isomerase [Planctomycetota bacterium]